MINLVPVRRLSQEISQNMVEIPQTGKQTNFRCLSLKNSVTTTETAITLKQVKN